MYKNRFIALFLIISLLLLITPNTILAQEGNVVVHDTNRLIPYNECPYNFIIYVEPGFTKIELRHYGENGIRVKFGGWKAWVEVNGQSIYSWSSFTEGEGSTWYDYTKGAYISDGEVQENFTDITDYIIDGNNTITFYHYTEGSGSGIEITIYYETTEETTVETYTETTQAQETVLPTETQKEFAADETLSEELSESLAQQEETEISITSKVDEEKLVFNFKSKYLNPDNPGDVYGRGIPGLTEEQLREYQRSPFYEKLIGPALYITDATSWEDVARLAVIESKVHYNYAQNLGYFKSLYGILSVFYVAQSFKESLGEIPKQFKTLKSVKSAKDLIKNKDTIIGLASNLTGIYETVTGIDKQGAEELGFPELDSRVMFVIGAVTSGGWSVLETMSREMFVENAKYSINYEVKKAVLNSSLAYHAQKIHELALIEQISADQIEEFYFHARRILILQELDNLLNIEDSISLWRENPDLVTSVFNFFGVVDAEAALQEDLNLYQQILANYEQAGNFLSSVMNELGINW